MQSDLAADPLGERGVQRLVGRARVDQRAMMHGGRGSGRETQRIHDDQNVATFGGLPRATPSPGQPDARASSVLIVTHESPFSSTVRATHSGSSWEVR